MVSLACGLALNGISGIDQSGHYLVLMIRTMQLTTNFPLFKVQLQGNLIQFLNVLKPMVEFDLLEVILDWEE